MTLTRGFIRNAVTTPLDARLMDMARHVANADGSPRTGVLGGASTSIVTATGTMNMAVAAAEFLTSKGKADGVAIFTNDGSVNVPITAAPVSNSRIDVIWVKHEDNTTGDAASLPIFGVTAGVAGAVPTKPAIPTGALELATLRIYSGTTATNGGANVTTNTYQMTVARGGIVPFRTKTDLDLWTTAISGQRAITLDTGQTYAYGSAGWLPLASAAGILMRRTASAGNVSNASYTDLSGTAFWAESNRIGFAAYANGVTVPFTGIYRVSFTIATTTNPVIAGVTVNKNAAVGITDLEIATGSGVAQGIAVASSSAEIKLSAGDVLRLYAIANSAITAWRTEANLSVFQVEFIRAS